MTLSTRLDTLSLISIQHELAMNIGLNPQLEAMVRQIMKICLRRLSVCRVYLFLPNQDKAPIPEGAAQGPSGSFYFCMPANRDSDILKSAMPGHWLRRFYKENVTQASIETIKSGDQYFHVYPLSNQAALILERLHEPLSELLIGALKPVFERLRTGCEAALEHERIVREIEGRRIAEKQIKHLAYHDDLTNLPNRRQLLQKINQLMSSTNPDSTHHALVYFGLDNFSDINESLGYQIGDLVLLQVAQHMPVPDKELNALARLDGDEFGVVLSSIGGDEQTARENAVAWARLALSMIAEPRQVNDHLLGVSISAGIVVFNTDEHEAEALISFGRSALGKAKALGRNTLHVHDRSLAEQAEQRLNLDLEMRRALSCDEFQLWLQPQVNAHGDIIGAETLIRWQHPEKGLCPPASFIPMAEKSGLIVRLSDWVIERVCSMIGDLEQNGFLDGNRHLAVNLSAKQFHQPDFVNGFLSILDKHQINPQHIELELTESTLLENTEETVDKMNRLKQFGLRFAIDDFGTGYSSLAYLHKLPIDRIKIDRAFIRDIEANPDNQAIADVILSLARHFDLKVTAEGVEKQEEMGWLKRADCTEYQGYLFHRPMPYHEFIALGPFD